jgi:BirA family biotin operon repressor/biotin-[acetyl-CoA-carboxylase] ligase
MKGEDMNKNNIIINNLNFQSIERKLSDKNYLLGHKILPYKKVESTMTVAKNFAISGIPHGTIVIADTQTLGRGRLGRAWSSPKGGLWFSIILRPELPLDEVSLITLVSGLAVSKTMQKLYKVQSGVKWPNDILVQNKKVCGILTEGLIGAENLEYAILGIGVNLNFDSAILPDELRETAATLLSITNHYVPSEDFLYELLDSLNFEYMEFIKDKKKFIKELEQHCITLGKEVFAYYHDKTITGTAKKITNRGGLVIKTDTDEIEVFSGEVSIR